MSESQVRVKLLVAAGIVGASVLGASFAGCSTAPPSSASTPFASYNGSPMAPGGGMPGAMYSGPAAAPGVSGYSQQNRQALMAETQRMGAQQSLTPQDIVAMKQQGVPDTQIAIVVQQRGASLKSMPGVDQYLAANGVNPAVLNGPTGGVPFAPAYPSPSQMAQPQMASMGQQPGYPAAGMQFAQASSPAGSMSAPTNPAMQQPTAGSDAGVQPAGFQSAAGAGGYDVTTAGGQSWRPMAAH